MLKMRKDGVTPEDGVLTTAFTGSTATREPSNTVLKSALSEVDILEKLDTKGESYSENFLPSFPIQSVMVLASETQNSPTKNTSSSHSFRT